MKTVIIEMNQPGPKENVLKGYRAAPEVLRTEILDLETGLDYDLI